MSTCNHSHRHHHDTKEEVVLYSIATIVTGIVLVAQYYVATLYGNIALLGDTIHVASDLLTHIGSLFVASVVLFATLSTRREFVARAIFAWAGILLLLFGVLHITHEAYARFLEPTDSANWIVFFIALIGGLGNMVVHIMLHRVPGELRTITHEILSSHVKADLLMSIAVAVSVLVRLWFGDLWAGFTYSDPVTALLVAVYMLYLVITLSIKLFRGDINHH
jgi:Co/Zn/Cd efflux system component